jgi:hypothetical protein
VFYTWVPANLVPHALPWLILLGLLALPRNRTLGAWWVWAPVACGFGFQALLRSSQSVLPSQAMEVFASPVTALCFGLAGLWLIASAADRKGRFKTFLFMVLVTGGLAAVAFGLAAFEEQSYELFFQGIIVLMCGLVIPLALSLTGLVCRRNYRPVAALVWSGIWTVVFSMVAVLPFLVIGVMAGPGNFAWLEFFAGVGVLAAVSLGSLLPFLVLSSASSLFRERLKSLLHIAGAGKPAMLSPGALDLEARDLKHGFGG